jgi:hypothetical protein
MTPWAPKNAAARTAATPGDDLFTEMHFRKFLADEKSAYHEAGHIAVALHFDEEVIIIADLQDKENGLAGISTAGFHDYEKYCIAVAGYLAEAKGMSGRDIDVDQCSLTINNVRTGLASGEPKFLIEVPLVGGGTLQAGCTRDDFVWRKGKYDVAREFNRSLAEDVVKEVAARFNGACWRRVEEIATILKRTGKFRNGI